MNEILYSFYNNDGLDNHGRTIHDMIAMTDEQLEKSHNAIQWIFPLNEPSLHNRTAPLLDDETIEALKNSTTFDVTFQYVSIRFLSFLRNTYPRWIHPHNHNYLRITRVIRSCYLLGQSHWAHLFYKMAIQWANEYPEEIGLTTLRYWKEAMANDAKLIK